MENTRKLCEGIEKPSIKKTGEEGVLLIRALAGGAKVLSNVNTINKGQHEGLPDGAVVETNAIFSLDGVMPVNAGRLTPEIEKLVMCHVNNQEALVNACITGDRDGVLQVFLNDPLVRLPNQEAIELFNLMFEKNSEYLKGVNR
jgi:alpha-galactosidase